MLVQSGHPHQWGHSTVLGTWIRRPPTWKSATEQPIRVGVPSQEHGQESTSIYTDDITAVWQRTC